MRSSSSSWQGVCPLCHQSHEKEDQHPSANDREGWKQCWTNKGQLWRTEPEIPVCRQYELSQRRLIQPELEKGIYPFGGVSLDRADIEWLLASHDNGQGPVEWSDEQQQRRHGLDLRGACVIEGTDLDKLPLTRLRGGLTFEERFALHTVPPFLCLRRVALMGVRLQEAVLRYAHLQEAILRDAHLERAVLWEAHLEGVVLIGAYLQGADLRRAYLQGADLRGACLQGADLRGASCSHINLFDTILADEHGVGPSLADVQWGETNLSLVDWSQIRILGDEQRASQPIADGKKKDSATRQKEYQAAYRANHQLAIALQNQGLIKDASRFTYRAKRLERVVHSYELRNISWRNKNTKKWTVNSIGKGLLRFPPALLSWLFSWFLFLIAGYGYRLRYCLLWYILVVGGCALAYLHMESHYFTWWTALAESVNVFHGRGASPNLPQLAHPARFAMLTIAEAWTGLVIEVVLVATLIQRFFGK
jgi:uncharacterized protein YjbI with pentapeptide repeats